MLDEAMERLRTGDRSALEIIYKATQKSVFALCYSYLRNYHNAQDIMQDTYINVMQYILHYKKGTNPKAWIYTIAKNLSLNEIKRRSREAAFTKDMENYIASDNELVSHDESGMIRLVQSTLRKDISAIILMHAVGGIPLKEIAKILDRPYATVRWQYSNALGKLRKRLKERENL
jgi:RNA polymerase sigma factor (sigma-70 family)